MRIFLALFATFLFAIPQPAEGVAPPALGAHYLDLGNSAQAQSDLLTSDSHGNFFIVSTVTAASGRPQIRAVKTDSQGSVLAELDFGGSSTATAQDTPTGVATDAQGNVIIAGTTYSQDFPLVSPLIQTTTAQAGFVIKLSPLLNTILFSTRLGGTQGTTAGAGGTSANGVAVDRAGNIYVTGTTSAIDFPVTPGAFQTTPLKGDQFGSPSYAFVMAIAAAGDRLLYSSYFGSDRTNCAGGSSCIGKFGFTTGKAIAVDSAGAVVIAGDTNAIGLPVTPGTLGQECSCALLSQAGFVAKFAAGASELAWSTYIPVPLFSSQSNLSISSLAFDRSGNVVIGGTAPYGFVATGGVVGPIFPGGNPPPNSAPYAGFVAKLDSAGSQYLFSTYFGGNLPANMNGVGSMALDSQGNIWVTGGSVPEELPFPPSVALLGPSYAAELSSDATAVLFAVTAPAGAAGRSIAATQPGAIAVLGGSGSLLISNSGPGPAVIGVANSAAFTVSGRVAPYELLSFYGSALGPASPLGGQVVNGRLTTSLGGVQVLFDGLPAPLLYVGPNQINAIVPAAVAGRDATAVQIITSTGRVSGPRLFVSPSAPDVFRLAGSPFETAIALNQDGAMNSAANPAAPGSVVTVWATGAGTPLGLPEPDGAIIGGFLESPSLPVSVLASTSFLTAGATLSLEVEYAGDAPGMVAGVMQVNFRLPRQAARNVAQVTCLLQVGASISTAFQIYSGQ